MTPPVNGRPGTGLILFLLRASPKTIALASAAGLIAGAGSAGLVALLQELLRRETDAPTVLAWAFAGLCAVTLVAHVCSQALVVRLAQGAVQRLCIRLVRQVLDVPLPRLEELAQHRLLAILTEDVLIIANASLGIPILCINVAIVACCVLYLAWAAPLVLATATPFAVIGIVSVYLLGTRAVGQLRLAREQQDQLVKHFRGLVEGVKQLKLNRQRREAFVMDLVGATANTLRDRATRGLTYYALAEGWGRTLFFLLLGVLFFVLPKLPGVGSEALRGSLLILLYTVSPMETILSWMPALGRARVSLRKVASLNSELGDFPTELRIEPLPDNWQRLELLGVTHSFRRESSADGFVLGPISFVLRRGEVIFLAGGNGSGKTTLAKVLVGLYDPGDGKILIDGQQLEPQQTDSYRELFAAVFQDSFLFDRLLGLDPQHVDRRASFLLGQMELTGKVHFVGGRLSTTDLSQGERKRLALIVAYLEDRPIFLFDEWAADQDPRFRRAFYLNLLPALKAEGKAVVVISHDEQFFASADRVLKLDSGRLVSKPITAARVNAGVTEGDR